MATALQAAKEFRFEVIGRSNLGISEDDIGDLSPTKHTQYRITSNKPVLSMQDAPAWTVDSGSEYNVDPED